MLFITLVSCARSELYTLVKECKLTIPVLIVSCTPAGVNTKHSCIDIIQQLRLEQLGKPWQVCTHNHGYRVRDVKESSKNYLTIVLQVVLDEGYFVFSLQTFS